MKPITMDAILFDMDGTLIDSSAAVHRAWGAWARKHHLDVDMILRVCQGRRAIDTITDVAPHLDAPVEAEWMLAQEVADTDGVVAIAGAAELLASLPPKRWAVVTSASRVLAEARIRAGGLPLPEVMITAELVQRGKPDPQGFLLGAQRLGFAPERCLVVEDTPAGLQAGRAASMSLLGLSTTFDASILPCERIIADYRSVRVQSAPLALSFTTLPRFH